MTEERTPDWKNWETQEAYFHLAQDESWGADLLEYAPEERAVELQDWVNAWLASGTDSYLERLADSFIQAALQKVDWERVARELCKEEDSELGNSFGEVV